MKQESIEAVGAKVAAGVTYAGIRALARLLINYKDKHGHHHALNWT